MASVSTLSFLKSRLYSKLRLFDVKLHFGHKISFLKSRPYVKLRFVKSRLYCNFNSSMYNVCPRCSAPAAFRSSPNLFLVAGRCRIAGLDRRPQEPQQVFQPWGFLRREFGVERHRLEYVHDDLRPSKAICG